MAWYEWINDTNKGTSCLTEVDFGNLNERTTGFKANTVASSKNVNTVIRQSNLVTVALMGALGITDGGVQSSLSYVQTLITNGLNAKITSYEGVQSPSLIAENSARGNSHKYAREDHTHKGVSSININGTTRSGSAGPIYAPTTSGSSKQLLESNGANNAPTWQNLVDLIYPVGSIYMSVDNTNPSNHFGGTWVAWGSGRVPVGINTSDGDFNSVEKTGGFKTVTLTENNIPRMSADTTSLRGKFYTKAAGSTSTHRQIIATLSGDETNVFKTVNPSGDVVWQGVVSDESIGTNQSGYEVNFNGTHSHQVGSLFPAGVQNLQPYITCYMWKRTE